MNINLITTLLVYAVSLIYLFITYLAFPYFIISKLAISSAFEYM